MGVPVGSFHPADNHLALNNTCSTVANVRDRPDSPGAFNKTSPTNGLTSVSLTPTLSWGTSSDATSYEYCIDTTDNSACDGTWTSTRMVTSANLSGLGWATTYYWQVRAVNTQGNIQANGGTWWAFTTEDQPLPGAFAKIAPADGASGQLTTLALNWGTSTGPTSYQYCIDTVDNDACDASWTTVGLVTSTQVTGLTEWTAYFWQGCPVGSTALPLQSMGAPPQPLTEKSSPPCRFASWLLQPGQPMWHVARFIMRLN